MHRNKFKKAFTHLGQYFLRYRLSNLLSFHLYSMLLSLRMWSGDVEKVPIAKQSFRVFHIRIIILQTKWFLIIFFNKESYPKITLTCDIIKQGRKVSKEESNFDIASQLILRQWSSFENFISIWIKWRKSHPGPT